MHLVVAMKAEALPLITHYGLKEEDSGGMFPVYQSDSRVVGAPTKAVLSMSHKQPVYCQVAARGI